VLVVLVLVVLVLVVLVLVVLVLDVLVLDVLVLVLVVLVLDVLVLVLVVLVLDVPVDDGAEVHAPTNAMTATIATRTLVAATAPAMLTEPSLPRQTVRHGEDDPRRRWPTRSDPA
jgi:hypothetical protein